MLSYPAFAVGVVLYNVIVCAGSALFGPAPAPEPEAELPTNLRAPVSYTLLQEEPVLLVKPPLLLPGVRLPEPVAEDGAEPLCIDP